MKRLPEYNSHLDNKRWISYLVIKIGNLLPLLFDLGAIRAMVTWPEFSATAYKIISALFRQGIRPRTVIDVGANVGQFTVAALNIFEDVYVHAFEPISACVEKFRSNTNKYRNVSIHAVGLGLRQGKTSFHINTYSLASSMLNISVRHKSEFLYATEKETITIDVSTLDHFFSSETLSAPVLLKIDVQGAERFVLDGGKETLKKVDYVLLETSFTQMYDGEALFVEVVDRMKTLKFDFIRPISFLKSPRTGEILQADILFKNNTL